MTTMEGNTPKAGAQAEPAPLGAKARSHDFLGRFREVVSDPLNLAVLRHPHAGHIDGEHVILHNGLRAFLAGPYAYYSDFARLLVINRGLHEPLEEFAFQEILKVMPEAPVMIELGAYWAHYSMWMKQHRPHATTYMVEPQDTNLESGRQHFALNGFTGEFIHDRVGVGHFTIDAFVRERGIARIDVLHADIQGYELEMLEGARETIAGQRIDHFVVSTHNQKLHDTTVSILETAGYRIEASSGPRHHTTSCDGVVIATRGDMPAVLAGLAFLGREEINKATPRQLLESIQQVIRSTAG